MNDASPQVPGINEDLVRRYAEGASPEGVRNLLTLFDHLRKCASRAEDLSRAYLSQMVKLEARLGASRQDPGPAFAREPDDRQLSKDLKKVRQVEDKAKAVAPAGDLAELEDLA